MNKKVGIVSKIVWLPVIFIIVLIFVLSSQNGDVSYETSTKIAQGISGKSIVSEFFNNFIRIMAHAGEYFVLALFVGLAIRVNGINGKLKFIYTVMISCSVAVMDEFYQIFIPGRYGDIRDIIVDGIGATAAASFIYLLTYRRWQCKLDYTPKKRKLLGIEIDNITGEEAIDGIIALARNGARNYVVTPNADHVMILQKNQEFKEAYKEADYVITDGSPIMWIAESYGIPLLEKIPGSDLLPMVCEKAAEEKLSVFILGAMEGVADRAAENYRKLYKGIRIVGTYSPPIGFMEKEEERNKIFSKINKCKPNILVVALGAPKQELFIYKYREKMNFNIALPFGAAVDFAAGEVQRAPKWMRKIGMEWFYRFIQEPGRLFKRYFIDDMKIFWIAWKYRNGGNESKK